MRQNKVNFYKFSFHLTDATDCSKTDVLLNPSKPGFHIGIGLEACATWFPSVPSRESQVYLV